MSLIGIDPAETADALDDHAEWAAANLMRELDSRIREEQVKVMRLHKIIAHLMTNPLDQREATNMTSDIDGQTGIVEIVDEGDDRTIIRIIAANEK